MKIHKEGYSIIAVVSLICIALFVLTCIVLPCIWVLIGIALLLFVGFTVRFFRVPKRYLPQREAHIVYAPADGTVVAIEEVYEEEILARKALKVSIFMSVWNVHINWFPVAGTLTYFKHHPGKYMVAWAEKSSTLNERTTTVVQMERHEVMFRQIAGFVARRIVNRSQVGQTAEQCAECGFIKFGSRVDLYLPLDSATQVRVGEKVVGTQTIIAELSVGDTGGLQGNGTDN